MKLLLTLLCCACIASSHAQNSALEFFAEAGENFTLYLNGERKNATPTSNVKVDNLAVDGVKARFVFESGTASFDKYVIVNPGERATYGIRKNKKGEYTLRLVSTGQVGTPEPLITTAIGKEPQAVQPTATPETNSITTTTTTTASTETASMSMNLNGINMSSTIDEKSGGVTMTLNASAPQQMTTTSTTIVTQSTSGTASNYQQEEPKRAVSADNCEMTRKEYDDVVASVKSKTFTDVQMTILKQAVKGNCVTTGQVKSLANLLSFEEDKLDFVKYAYDYTLDKENYFKVNDIFSFDSSVEELNEYLQQKN